jgi:hypothetical protein
MMEFSLSRKHIKILLSIQTLPLRGGGGTWGDNKRRRKMAKLPKFRSVEQLQKLCERASKKSCLESAMKSDEVRKIVKRIKERCVERAIDGFETIKISVLGLPEEIKNAVIESCKNSGFSVTDIMGMNISEVSWKK